MRWIAVGFGVMAVLLCAFVAPRAFGDQEQTDSLRLRFAGDEVRLAMPAVGGRHLVQVRVGGAGPHGFLIDTGSTVSVIDATIAATLGLEVIGARAVGAPGGQEIEASLVAVPALGVGDLTIEGARMVALGLKEMTGGVIEGVLGMDLFEDVLLTLDSARGLATVSRGALLRSDPAVVALDAVSDGINFNLDVAGTPVRVHLDTGSPGGLTLPIALMDSLPLAPGPGRRGRIGLVGGDRSLVTRQLDGVVRAGTLEYRNPLVAFMDPAPPQGNFGAALADELVIVIDQRSRLVSLRRSGAAEAGPTNVVAQPTPRTPRRLGVRFGGPGGSLSTIGSVDAGSLGERAGFQAGDVVVHLNGRSMADYSAAELGELVRGATPLTWVLERGGERITIVVR